MFLQPIIRSLLLALCLSASGFANTIQYNVVDDELSIDVQDMPLREFLAPLANAGVTVMISPEIESSISFQHDTLSTKKSLHRILRDLNFTLTWHVLESPLGDIRRLHRIHIFSPGNPRAVDRLAEKNPTVENDGKTIRIRYLRNELLLKLSDKASLKDLKSILASVNGAPLESIGRTGLYRIRLMDGTDSVERATELLKHELVEHAEPNFLYTPADPRSSQGIPGEPGTSTVADGAVPVAVLDTGLSPGAEGLTGVIATLDSTNPQNKISDKHGHGTQMAYLAAGNIQPSGITTDAAGGAPVVAIKAFGDDGFVSNFQMMNALEFAVASGAGVVNMSWSSDHASQFMQDALKDVAARDLVIVAASGNAPTGREVYPAAYDHVLAVSALTSDGTPWPASNHGKFVDLSAAGIAAFPVGSGGGAAGTYSGTSIASAYVSRIVSAYRTQHSDLSAGEVVSSILKELSPIPDTGDRYYGRGALDNQAIERLLP